MTGDALRGIAMVWDRTDPIPAEDPKARTARSRMRSDLRRWAQEVDAAGAAPARPSLPPGVEPVGWSDREQAWVVMRKDVPDGWEFTWGACLAWSTGNPGAYQTTLVLARPVPEPPQPETEWVRWWEAPGRRLATGSTEDGGNIEAGTLLGAIMDAHTAEHEPVGIYVEYEMPELGTTGNPARNTATGPVLVLVDSERRSQ